MAIQQNSTVESEGGREKRSWERAFLTAFARTGNATLAARAAKIDRSSAYKLRDEAPDFAAAWDEAKEMAADLLEAAAHRRAVTGVLEPVFYQGERVGSIRRYSDSLLALLLKANRPKKFRERVTHGGEIGLNLPDALLGALEKVYGEGEVDDEAGDSSDAPGADG